MKYCPKCKTFYNEPNVFYCLKDNYRLEEVTEEESGKIGEEIRNENIRKNTSVKKNIPRCPVCESIAVKKISAAKRGLHAWAFGIFSKTAFSQFECEDCGYKF